MKKWWKWIIILGLIIGGLSFLRGGQKQMATPSTTTTAPRSVAVVVHEAGQRDLVKRLQVTGNIRPVREVSVVPKIGGIVNTIAVELGLDR